MQTDYPSSAQFLTIGDEGLKAFNMSVLGATNDYQWKEFQGLVRLQTSLSQPCRFDLYLCNNVMAVITLQYVKMQ